MNKTKENVRSGKISAQEAYNNLYPIVGERYAKHLPTLRWLKNLINGRKIQQKIATKKQNNIKK